MGKNILNLPEGTDFGAEHFAGARDFGFHGSAEGAKPTRAAAKAPASKSGSGKLPGASAIPKVEPHADGSYTVHHSSGLRTLHHSDGGHSNYHTNGKVEHFYAHGGHATHHTDGKVETHDHDDAGQDRTMITKAVHQHEDADHGGKHTALKLARGGHVGKARHGKAHKSRHAAPAMSSAPMNPAPTPDDMSSPVAPMADAAPPSAGPDPTATADPTGAAPTPMAKGGKVRSNC